MIVRATLPASFGDYSGVHANAVATQAAAQRRQERSKRHELIRAYLAAPSRLDCVVPGLSRMPPGLGNDRLRAVRYGSPDLSMADLASAGARHLSASPEEMQAAIVAQRIRCWRAIHGR